MKKARCIILVVTFFTVLCLQSNGFSSTETVPFFTEDELQQLVYDPDEWSKELEEYQDTLAYTAKCIRCPTVSIIAPEAVKNVYLADTPLALLVYLKGTLARVDIKTLIVKARKGFFTLDITERIRPFIRRPHQGEDADWVVDANIAEIPSGKFKVILSVKDTEGHEKEMTALLQVGKK